MEQLPLSVVIITRNRPQFVPSSLQHVLEQDYSPLDVILIDASDGDQTRQMMTNFGQVHYIPLENAAHQMPRSRNEGIRVSRGEIIAFVDDDSLVQPGWARNLMAHYSSPDVGGVGGLVIAPGESPRRLGILPSVTSTGSVLGDFNLLTSGPIEVGHLMGCNMSFRREALRAVGGFDTLFDASNFREETDVCIGVRKAGFKLIYDSNVAVIHLYAAKDGFERDASRDAQYRFSIVKNMTYFRLKHFISARTVLSLFAWAPLSILFSEIRANRTRGIVTAWNDWKARAAGVHTFLNHGR